MGDTNIAAKIGDIIRAERERVTASGVVDLTVGIPLRPLSRSVSTFKYTLKRRAEFVRNTDLLDEQTREEALRSLNQDHRWFSYLRGQTAAVIRHNHDVMTSLSDTAADRRYTREMRTRMLGVIYIILQHEAEAKEDAKNAESRCCTID